MSGVAIRSAVASVLLVLLCGAIGVGCTSTVADLFGSEAEPELANGDDSGSESELEPELEQEPHLDQAVEPAELVRVVDGDSVELTIDGSATDVRLADYNAPELYRPSASNSAADSRDERSCNGEAAKAALTDLLAGGSLGVVGDETDRFGRRLSDIQIADGRFVSAEMITQGWGLAVGADNDFARAQMKQAAAARVGMWGPQCGSPLTTELVVGQTQVDPSGSDRDNLNDEWIQIENRSNATIDLAGWTIRDDTTGHRFPLAGSLGEGATMTVRSGSGRSTDSDFFLEETFPVWSNQGETVLLIDPNGVLAQWAFID